MGPASAIPISELPSELFRVIASHLPLAYRPSTLLSLALTCHHFYEVVVPYLLYNAVRVEGEEQALRTLNTLTAKAAPMNLNEEEIQKKPNLSPSHYIHHLCIDTSINPSSDHSIKALRKLIDVDGLLHLSDLTLRVNGEWDSDLSDSTESLPASTNINFTLPSLVLVESLKKCPNLKNVYLADYTQVYEERWLKHKLFSINLKNLTSIHFESNLCTPSPTFNFLQLPPNLHTLELRLSYDEDESDCLDASGPGGLFDCVIPNLHTLIIDEFNVSDPTSSKAFWKAHPGIKRLVLGNRVIGNWFDNFEVGMLPDLRYLECHINYALVLLRYASKMLIRLSLLSTYRAQGAYLLRAVVPGGVLLGLRSLSIDLILGNGGKQEGHLWREEEDGVVSKADTKKQARQFDGNYIMSISKGAPNLEELELIGPSDDSLDSICASLSRFPKLQRLTLSGGIYNEPFFARSVSWADYAEFGIDGIPKKGYEKKKYEPESFNQAVRDLANGCRTLTVVTMSNFAGKLVIQYGLSARIVRECEGGLVKEIKRIRPWGNIIGRENEW